MKDQYKIPVERFKAAYSVAKWNERMSKSGKYYVWSDPNDDSIWMRLPIDEYASDYLFYQEKNIKMLLFALNQPEEEQFIFELISQLKNYNYKLINRIVGKNKKINTTIPYELANVVPEKNIEAFRYFYQTKSKKNRYLPIERFELNHTEVGSFVIPVSITVEEEKNTTLLPIQSDTNFILHKYLESLDTLTKIPRNSAENFADRIIGESIDSKIVKDFYGIDRSIARFSEKYSKEIDHVLIGSKGSMLLDFGLNIDQQKFKEVDVSGVGVLSEEFIQVLETREIQADDTRIEALDTSMDVVVESIDRSGKVKFTITSIGKDKLDRPFKAYSGDMAKAKLDVFAELFKNSGITKISGDVYKQKGKIGKIVIDNIGESSSKNQNTELFG